MRKIVALTAFIFALFASATAAEAATCFWVGGTGTWSTLNLTSWASATNGTPGTCAATGGVPKQAGDVATFDANSGGGTVTPNFNMSILNITMTAFTGTLDFSANNNSPTLSQFNDSSTATNTLNCGSGTWTFNSTTGSNWNGADANATFSCASASFVIQPSSAPTGSISFAPKAGFSAGAFSLIWPATPTYGFTFSPTTGMTVASLTVSGAVGVLLIAGGTTLTISNTVSWAGTLTYPLMVEPSLLNGAQATITATAGSTLSYVGLFSTKFTNSATAANSFNFGNNSGITITPPSAGGGGGFMILHP